MFELTFIEAMEEVLNKQGFAVGENFQKGVFLCLNGEGDIILKERKAGEIGYNVIGNPVLSKGLLYQKYKIIIAATDKELGLK